MRVIASVFALLLLLAVCPVAALEPVDWSHSIGREARIEGIQTNAVLEFGNLLLMAHEQLLVTDVADPTSPVVIGSVDLPGPAVRMQAYGSRVCVCCGSQGIALVDLSDPSSPSIVDTFDTAATAVDVIQRSQHLLVLGQEGSLIVLDGLDSGSLTAVGRLDDLGASNCVASSGDLTLVGTNDGIVLVDMSDPASPAVQSRWNVHRSGLDNDTVYGYRGPVFRDLLIDGELVIAASYQLVDWYWDPEEDDILVFRNQLMLLDYGQPLSPQYGSCYDFKINSLVMLPEHVLGAGQGLVVVERPDQAFDDLNVVLAVEPVRWDVQVALVGDELYAVSEDRELFHRDITYFQTVMAHSSFEVSDGFWPSFSRGEWRFYTSNRAGEDWCSAGCQGYDMEDPLNPVVRVSGGIEGHEEYDGCYAFVEVRGISEDRVVMAEWINSNQERVRIFDTHSDASALIGYDSEYNYSRWSVLAGDLLWKTKGLSLVAYDHSDLANLTIVSKNDIDGLTFRPRTFYEDGFLVFLNINGIQTLDVRNPSAPYLLAEIEYDLLPWFYSIGLYSSGSLITACDGGLVLFEDLDTGAPYVAGQYFTDWTPRWLLLSEMGLVAADEDGFQLFDVADPADPHPVSARVEIPVDGLVDHGSLLYVSTTGHNIELYDVADPVAPVYIGCAHASSSRVPAIHGDALVAGTSVFPLHRSAANPVADTPTPTASLAIHPNPFNPRTTVTFTLPRAGRVAVDVFDLRGRHVRTLCDERRPEGVNRLEWDGRADSGRDLPSGTYLVRAKGEGLERTSKMTLVR